VETLDSPTSGSARSSPGLEGADALKARAAALREAAAALEREAWRLDAQRPWNCFVQARAREPSQ
jgi:hypothetical protein